jgi:hypothetical protein
VSLPEYEIANKIRYSGDAAWELVAQSSEVVVGRGKKVTRFQPEQANKADVLKHVLGPTGNLRAPAIRVGKRLIVGFNAEAYADFFG